MGSIPASRIVNITPSVVSAGGTGLDLCGLVLTQSIRVPIGEVMSFVLADDVAAFFGLSSPEYQIALRYFAGYDNSPQKPGQILFSQYAETAVAAYLRGAYVGSMTLAELQALSGTLTLTIDGDAVTSANIDLSTATSFSNAASLITTALGFSDGVGTASTTSSSAVLNVTAVASGEISVGDLVAGAGIPAGTRIASLGTGTGGVGTYNMTNAATATASGVSVHFGSVVASYDSTWGAFVITSGLIGASSTITAADADALSTGLKLTTAAGAVLSQGSDAMTPAGAMTTVVNDTQNFASFTTAWLPTHDEMVAFAAWNNSKSNRFVYVQWDNDAALTTTDDSSTALAAILAAHYAAVFPLYEPLDGAYKAAAVMGMIASIDFTRVNGRVNIALRSQAGLAAGVTNDAIAAQLETNGCNFYGAYATAAQGFIFFYDGSVTGDFLWCDTLINQIWMTNAFQLSLMELLTAVTNIPYNDQGYALIEAALQSPIDDAVSFGAIQKGVTLSALQIAEINNSAGADVATTIQLRGWYLQVRAATPQVRAARGSPPITFWYTDGGSVQRIDMNSAEVQ